MPAPYDPVPVLNVSGEDIPSHAVVEPTGVITDGAFEVTKPTRSGNRAVLVNGPGTIPDGKAGQAYGHPRVVVRVDGDPTVGEEWGAQSGSWGLGDTRGGFIVLTEAVDSRVNAIRFGAGQEIGAGSGPDPDTEDACRGPLAGLRTYECVEFVILSNGSAVDDATFAGVWDATESGWLGDEVIVTGDGDTRVILARSAGRYYLRLEGETEAWEGYEVGCVGDYLEFAADADPTADDDDGTMSGSGNPPDDCADNTFRVRVKCGPCALTFAACDVPSFEVPRELCMAVIWDETKTPADCAECDTTAVITYGLHAIDCTEYGGTGTGYFTGWFNPAVATTEACRDLYTGAGASNWVPGATFDMGMRVNGSGAGISFEPRFAGLPTGSVCTSTESAIVQGGGCASVAAGDITLDPFLVDANVTINVPQVFTPNTSCKTPTSLLTGYRIIVGPVPAGGCTAENMLALTYAGVCDAPACPDGAADEYAFTLAGGTGDYAQLNGAWTLAHVSADEWAGTLGSCTATLDASTGIIEFAAPGLASVLRLTPDPDPFACCGDTVYITLDGDTPGVGDKPTTPVTMSPVGDCAGCP